MWKGEFSSGLVNMKQNFYKSHLHFLLKIENQSIAKLVNIKVEHLYLDLATCVAKLCVLSTKSRIGKNQFPQFKNTISIGTTFVKNITISSGDWV